jgi:adenylosuccinate synthase
VIVGAQWGDEGKGKVVDIFTERADLVVRFAGGPNAGHTLVVGGDKLVVRLVPSGILRPGSQCVLAQGMVIDPLTLAEELAELDRRGLRAHERMLLSDRAHVILPVHVLVDGAREKGLRAIGTTKRGVGPCYEDKMARVGVRAALLARPAELHEAAGILVERWAPLLRAADVPVPDVRAMLEPLLRVADTLVPLLGDAGQRTHAALRAGQKVLFEGAQGALLDIDHGTYPYVTSSSAVAGGACTGAGVGPTSIQEVVGLAKAYCTRVGGGPFPTELSDALGARLRDVGGEYGSVTGRPRRTGWLDLPALRYAARVNGLSSLALTKLDVLTGLSELKVCVAYKVRGQETNEFPIDDLDAATPVFKTMQPWSEPLGIPKSLADLPPAVRAYVDLVEQACEVPLCLLSVGADRDHTLMLRAPFGTMA